MFYAYSERLCDCEFIAYNILHCELFYAIKSAKAVTLLPIVLVALIALPFIVDFNDIGDTITTIWFLTLSTVLGILGLQVISITKVRREIINSVKIINNAVLECCQHKTFKNFIFLLKSHFVWIEDIIWVKRPLYRAKKLHFRLAKG